MTVSAISPRPQNINTVEAAFGRFFFAGDSVVYFSPTLSSANDVGRFYQINDPTSDQISDLLDTDGGVIPVDGASGIKELIKFRRGLLIFADNGVWYLSGPDGVFTANGFSLDKVTDRGCTFKDSIVLAESVVFYFSEEGIIQLAENEFNVIKDTDLTLTTIRGHYLEFYEGVDVAGGYKPLTKEVWWWQKTRQNDQPPMRPNGLPTSRGLVFDLKSQAFYPQQTDSFDDFSKPVRVNADFYFTRWERRVNSVEPSFERVQIEYRLQDVTSDTFSDGAFPPYTAYMETGNETLSKPVNSKAVLEANFIFQRTETQITDYDWVTGDYTYDNPSGCLLQLKWDYDNTADGNKWIGSTPLSPNLSDNRQIQIYNPNVRGYIPEEIPSPINDGNAVIRRRQRLRGNGDAVRFRFESEDNKDMQMLGYTVAYTMKGRQ